MLMNAILKEIPFHLIGKSAVTFAKRIIKEYSLKRNSIIRKQFMRERLNLGSQSNAYTKISCKSLWSDVNSPRKA